MLRNISSPEVSDVFQKSQQLGLLNDEDTAVIFYSLDLLNERLEHLKSEFPSRVHHSIAIKTNPEKAVLKHIINRAFGLESASLEELQLALSCGLAPKNAVFDSPVKTRKEIGWCEEHCPDMIVNANCLEELDRYSPQSSLRIGLRINPEMAIDAPELYNVSGVRSKFGVPISKRNEILNRAVKPPFIAGLHIHAGSDVGDFEPNLKAVSKIVELAEDIHRFRDKHGVAQRIEFIDIGGGISGDRDENGINSGLGSYVAALKMASPNLFEQFEVITEFGRFIQFDNAFVVSDVEYVLPTDGVNPKTAILHVGADMFLRQTYSNIKEAYPLTVMNADGRLKKGGELERFDIAGPLCFAGDFLFRNRELQSIRSGEKLAISRVGANTTALWSRHCSREIPKLIAYSLKDDNYFVARQRKTVTEL